MFKMLKYELRKTMLIPLIILGICIATEIFFLISVYITDNKNITMISFMALYLIGLFSYFYIMIWGIIQYSNDLKNKSGYLVFMTPISSYKILGAKLLSILLMGILFVVVIVGLGILDYKILQAETSFPIVIEFSDVFLEAFGTSLNNVLIGIALYILIMLVSYFMVITIAYFSISLSSTLLQTKKIKGFVSVLFFIIITIAVTYLSEKLPEISSFSNTTFLGSMLRELPKFLIYLITTIAGYIGSAILIDKKISL